MLRREFPITGGLPRSVEGLGILPFFGIKMEIVMSSEYKRVVMGLLLIFVFIPMFAYLSLFEFIPAVHVWERDAGYPFGKICEVYNTCNR